jgi:hypothetical protein
MAALEQGTLTVRVPRTLLRGMKSMDYDYHWDTWFLPKFKQDFPNFDLHFEVMERELLEKAMQSPPDQHFPDVAFVENLREYAPLRESNAVISMWGRSRLEWHGWWVIFRQAPNMAAARAFLLWLAHPLHYKPSWNVSTKSISASDQAAVEALSREAVQDYVKEDLDALWSTFDPQAARFSGPEHDVKAGMFKVFNDVTVAPSIVEPILTFGNSRLAFVLVAASGEGPKDFGMIHSAVILRNEGGGWKVLYVEPVSPLPLLEDLLSSLDRLGFRDDIAETAPEITLIGPPDHAVLPSQPNPEMEWAKIDPKPATYVFEFQQRLPWGKDRWEPSYLNLVSPVSDGPTLHQEYSHAAGRWRVWAITKGGTVSMSEWRTITLTP